LIESSSSLGCLLDRLVEIAGEHEYLVQPCHPEDALNLRVHPKEHEFSVFFDQRFAKAQEAGRGWTN